MLFHDVLIETWMVHFLKTFGHLDLQTFSLKIIFNWNVQVAYIINTSYQN